LNGEYWLALIVLPVFLWLWTYDYVEIKEPGSDQAVNGLGDGTAS